ncbi:alpha/beta hydrolase [Xanthomonas citri]|uniref:alpha/beta hydrolase n=1 Tax=Xanthomonas citri TaxID=346 RepID=UPI0001CED08A|nr:alpha/beta hydrolase-fold protein [Xanthomonas citri]EFF43501.1 predicted hydrolase [Xanthomonas citri pv. aurantifolii str. ICPB 11122]
MNPTTWRGLTPRCSSPGANRLRIGAALTNARAPLARCYRFESVLVGEQGAGRWRIRFAIPRAAPPRRGFPALWMLDGNRALTRFDPVTLRRLSCLPVPPVLVFVDVDHTLLIDLPSRARHYTFLPADYPFLAAPGASEELVGGGAQELLDLLLQEAVPAVRQRVRLDDRRQVMWGHSLAGLFVLHALYAGAAWFTGFAAASPSLWWGQGALLGEPERRFVARGPHQSAHLWLLLGGAERAGQIDARRRLDCDRAALLSAIQGAPADAAHHLAGRLATLPGLAVRYREFPALHHAAVFQASLRAVLRDVAGLPVRGRYGRRV